MTLKKLNEKDSKFFNRKEINFEYTSKGTTPSKDEIKKLISQNEKTKEELIFIEKINQKYGSQKINIITKIYKTEQDLQNTEVINKEKKKEKPKEQPKPEAPKEEPKKEEKKEEPKVEEKKETSKEEKKEEKKEA